METELTRKQGSQYTHISDKTDFKTKAIKKGTI